MKHTEKHGCSHGSKHSCHSQKKIDFLLWGSLAIVAPSYLIHLLFSDAISGMEYLSTFVHTSYEFINEMWWSLILATFFVGLIGFIPRDLMQGIMGTKKGVSGMVRAAFAGLFLDLCSHGILMVGAKLYERGVSIGQVMAFLIASPWNSFSLTLIFISLIGIKYTLIIIFASLVVAVITGLIFNFLVQLEWIDPNPNAQDLPDDFSIKETFKEEWKKAEIRPSSILNVFKNGLREARMVLRWLLLGVVLAGLIRSFVPIEMFAEWFAPTLLGLGTTIVAATIIEVCSEGSAPIATDIINRANAPGNGFAFLMAGVSTDYTEIMILRETTGRWTIPLLLPLISLPQIILIGYLINSYAQ
jgi:hypothetical protein